MKKLLFVFVLMLGMTACGGNSTNSGNSIDSVNIDSTTVDSIDTVANDTICID